MRKKVPENQSDLAAYYFHQGTNYHTYEYLGVSKEPGGYRFRVWAPGASAVELVGDYFGWDGGIPMERDETAGVWTLLYRCECSLEGEKYKFKVFSSAGCRYKSDPYAFASETLVHTASIINTERDYPWGDENWLKKRKQVLPKPGNYPLPLNIYEMHLGSWRTRDGKTNKEGDAYLNYREIADELAVYLRQMGYTHVELLPIMEHPFDGSWGYQVCGYYAPTARYGTPADFKYFVDTLHKQGIGVILDWVPAHFPKDEHGLYEFDGSPLYEYQGDDRMEQKSWGTRCFDVGRNEVQSFLVSNALFWMREYHIDGLRVDAVASMLYLDYDKKPGEWFPNSKGGRENLEAIAFFKKLNGTVNAEFPDVMMIAEESTAWPGVTRPASEGGLGFQFKWNMGWANDMFEYLSLDPLARRYHHSKLTFPMMYAFSENYVLPVSHDEVVHGKKSLLDKCAGDYLAKFATTRTFMLFQMTHPGKKMTFMGCEYGQFREWDYENQLEWFMTDYDMHRKLHRYSAELGHFYLNTPQLWKDDFSWEGFEWVYPDLADWNIVVYKRKAVGELPLTVVLEFSGEDRKDFQIEVSSEYDAYEVVFTTDTAEYGGCGLLLKEYPVLTKDGRYYISLDLPAECGVVLRPKHSQFILK